MNLPREEWSLKIMLGILTNKKMELDEKAEGLRRAQEFMAATGGDHDAAVRDLISLMSS